MTRYFGTKKYRQNLETCLDRTRRNARLNSNLDSVSKEMMKDFNLSEKKRSQLVGFLEKSVVGTKKREYRRYKIEPEYSKIVRKNLSHQEMLKYAQEMPTIGMTKYTERDILKKVNAKKMEVNFPDVLHAVMNEVKIEFIEITHEDGVNTRVRPMSGEDLHPKVFGYKLLGRTSNYNEYLRIREHMNASLFITYPLYRRMFKCCTMELPPSMIDFLRFKQHSINFDQLLTLINEQIHQGSSSIQHFYTKIIKLCELDKTHVSKKLRKRYWQTGSALLSEFISRNMRNTILSILEEVKTMKDVPMLTLKLVYTGRFAIKPIEDNMYGLFSNLIDAILDIGENFESLESLMLKYKEKTYVKIYITEDDVLELKQLLANNLHLPLIPICEYIDCISDDFMPIIKEQEIYDDNIDVDMTFEEGLGKINYFQTFINRVLGMVDNEYFDYIKLTQIDCKEQLKNAIETLIDHIAYKLTSQHEWENRDICETFEMLATRAKQLPKTTEELMEMGEYKRLSSRCTLNFLTIQLLEQH